MAIYCLGIGQLFSWGTTFYIFGLSLVTIEQDLSLNRSSAALAFPLALLFEGILSGFIGLLIVRHRGEYVMAGGSLLGGTGLLILGSAGSLIQFYIAWALIGASFACTLYTPLLSIIATRYPASYRSKVAIISLIAGFSSTIFLPVGHWLISKIGWRDCLLLYAAFNVFFCTPVYWIGIKAIRIKNSGMIHAEVSTSDAGCGNSCGCKLRIYVYLAVFVAMIGALSGTIAAHLIPMLIELGLKTEDALLVPAAIGALQTLSRLPMLLNFVDKKVHFLNAALMFLFPIAIILLKISEGSSAILFAFVLLYGIAHGGWTIVRATAVSQYLGSKNAAISNGTIAFWSTFGKIALPSFVAFLWTPDCGYFYGYWILLTVSLLGFFSYVLAQATYFRKKTKH